MAHHETYDVFALRFGERPERKRHENFLETVDAHDAPMPIDYFLWVIRNANRTVVVDTGFGRCGGGASPAHGHSPALGGAREHRSRFGTGRGRDHHPPALRPCRDARRLPAGAVPCPGIRNAVRHRTLDARRQRTRRLLGGACRGARASAVREAGSRSTGRTARSRPASRCTACPDTPWECRRYGCRRVGDGCCSRPTRRTTTSTGCGASRSQSAGPETTCSRATRRFELLADSEDHVVPGHDPLVRDIYPAAGGPHGSDVVRLDAAPRKTLRDVFPDR